VGYRGLARNETFRLFEVLVERVLRRFLAVVDVLVWARAPGAERKTPSAVNRRIIPTGRTLYLAFKHFIIGPTSVSVYGIRLVRTSSRRLRDGDIIWDRFAP